MTIEIEKLNPYSSGISYIIKNYNEKNPHSSIRLIVGTDPTNCKLDYIHGAGSLINLNDDQKKEVLETILKERKGYIILNTTQKLVADYIAKNFQTYYHIEVPVGYNNGFQHNVCFRNHVNINFYCKVPKRQQYDANDIEGKLRGILKAKRRKADYVEEFIGSL